MIRSGSCRRRAEYRSLISGPEAANPPTRICELRLAADPAAWEGAGFEVGDGVSVIGSVPVRLLGPDAGRGITGWTLDVEPQDLDGLPTQGGGAPPPTPGTHPNTASGVDHVVVFTGGLERTITAFERSGIRCRRVREVGPPDEQLRQAFFRLGPTIIEVVGVPPEQAGPDGSARFWGLTVVVDDLDGIAAELGDLIGRVKDAVQPGRRIATLRREAGLGIPVALITPETK